MKSSCENVIVSGHMEDTENTEDTQTKQGLSERLPLKESPDKRKILATFLFAFIYVSNYQLACKHNKCANLSLNKYQSN